MGLRLRVALVLAGLLWAATAAAQTPTPFNYWQNAAGIVLAPLGGPVPDWRASVGIGMAVLPLYEGSSRYRAVPAPSFDIRYKDIAFASSGDGVGVNILHGKTYRAGIAVGYDLGRDEDVSGRLRGLGNVEGAPEVRLFAEGVVLPFVLTADLRRALGGNEGLIGDIGAYVPVVARNDLIVFLGPSVTFADDRYMQSYFGISSAQAAAAQFPVYHAQAGFKNFGVGASAIYFFSDHWFLDGDLSLERLVDSAGNSPIVQDRNQFAASLIMGYQF
ncbi:MAG TPA: MipA/OmpV family protein [Stellaceae bacterium]|nr:MipA/OmpV family protein [Stellaceae bacterium]